MCHIEDFYAELLVYLVECIHITVYEEFSLPIKVALKFPSLI
jgi:hypothetical protein